MNDKTPTANSSLKHRARFRTAGVIVLLLGVAARAFCIGFGLVLRT